MEKPTKEQAIEHVNKGIAQAQQSTEELQAAFQSGNKETILDAIKSNLLFLAIPVGVLILLTLFILGGPSAPSSKEAEKALVWALENDSTMNLIGGLGMSTTFEDFEVSDCQETSDEPITFNCLIEATVVTDLGAIGGLFGALAGNKKSKNKDNKQREPFRERGDFALIDGKWQVTNL